MINAKREKIESKWATYYISQKPRLKNSSPRIAWYDLWRLMDTIVLDAESEMQRLEIACHARKRMGSGGSPIICAEDTRNAAKVVQLPGRNVLNQGLLKSAAETLTTGRGNDEVSMRDDKSEEKLTILTDELKDAQIAELQEKVSIFKAKLESAEKQASDSHRKAEAYMQTTLRLSATNDILTAENQRLTHELVEARMRGVGLEEMLSSNLKRVALLVEELNKTRASILSNRLGPIAIQSMTGLVERNPLSANASHSEPSCKTR